MRDVVAGLREVLGARLVAYLSGLSSTAELSQWTAGMAEPPAEVSRRLRCACYVTGLLQEREGDVTIQSWFQGMNPLLEDEAPAMLLREAEIGDAIHMVTLAARHFAAEG
jgi:hypothetical protein